MNKKTIRIGFKYFGSTFNPQDFLLIKILKKMYNVVITDNPDYMFYSIYPEIIKRKSLYKKGDFVKRFLPIRFYIFLRKICFFIINPKSKRKITPKGDFIKILCLFENVKPDMKIYDWAFSYYYDEELNHPKHMRFPGYMYSYPHLGNSLTKKKSNIPKIIEQKTKFCNFIYTHDVLLRNNFFKKLSKYKRVDAPGRCMTNMLPISHNNPKESHDAKNRMEKKIDFIKPYKFTIAFENSCTEGYTTEKICEAMLANTIPIFYGNPLIGRDFNVKSFINCHDFKNFNEVIKKVIELDNNDKLYEEMLNQPCFNDNTPSKYTDMKRIEKRLIEIFGDPYTNGEKENE